MVIFKGDHHVWEHHPASKWSFSEETVMSGNTTQHQNGLFQRRPSCLGTPPSIKMVFFRGERKAMGTVHEMIERRGLRISAVIPAHNEAKNLPYVLPLIPGWVHEVILVNDHSSDDTVEVAHRCLPNIRIINTQHRHGKGAALQAGFVNATGDIIIMLDADGSSDPQEIPHFIEALLGGAYFALGTRFIDGGKSADITPLRRLGAHTLILIANQLFRIHLSDMFCGLNAFWKDSLNYFNVDCEGFDVETLLVLRACKANLEIVEVPSYEHARIHGTSNFRIIEDGWQVLKMIVKEWMNGRSVIKRVRISHPSQQSNFAWDGLTTEQIGAPQ
jgi:glycosyltransferase involved in cell wall biosynthesis